MSRRTQENVVAGVVLLVFVAALAISFGYGPRARLVPVPIAALGILLTVLQILWQNLRPADDLRIDAFELFTGGKAGAGRQPGAPAGAPRAASPAPAPAGRWGGLGREVSAFATVAAVIALFLVLGPIPAVFVFTAGYLVLGRHHTRLRALAYACLATALIYGLFGQLLDVDLNRGVAMPWINAFVRF